MGKVQKVRDSKKIMNSLDVIVRFRQRDRVGPRDFLIPRFKWRVVAPNNARQSSPEQRCGASPGPLPVSADWPSANPARPITVPGSETVSIGQRPLFQLAFSHTTHHTTTHCQQSKMRWLSPGSNYNFALPSLVRGCVCVCVFGCAKR